MHKCHHAQIVEAIAKLRSDVTNNDNHFEQMWATWKLFRNGRSSRRLITWKHGQNWNIIEWLYANPNWVKTCIDHGNYYRFTTSCWYSNMSQGYFPQGYQKIYRKGDILVAHIICGNVPNWGKGILLNLAKALHALILINLFTCFLHDGYFCFGKCINAFLLANLDIIHIEWFCISKEQM